MSNLSEQIKQNNATAFTHSGKFHADDVFSSALLLYLNPETVSSEETKSRKILTELYLISAEADTTTIRKTAASVKTAFHMPLSDFFGRNWEQKSLVKSSHRNSMSPLCSH